MEVTDGGFNLVILGKSGVIQSSSMILSIECVAARAMQNTVTCGVSFVDGLPVFFLGSTHNFIVCGCHLITDPLSQGVGF